MSRSIQRPFRLLSACLALLLSAPLFAAEAREESIIDTTREAKFSSQELQKVLATIDERLSNSGDYTAQMLVTEQARDGTRFALEITVHRRDATNDLLFVITGPKVAAGGGFLRIDKNMFEYRPATGQWERRTVRSTIEGTSTQIADYDLSNLAGEYQAADEGPEKLGKLQTRRLYLKARPGVETAAPAMRIWVTADGNIVKQEHFALSGKKLRVEALPRHARIFNEAANKYTYYPPEILIKDELRGSQALIKILKVDVRPLPPNMFTKAWLESRSR